MFRHLALREARSRSVQRIVERIPEGLMWRLRALRPQPTGNECIVAEAAAAPFVMRSRGTLCHFIYGEDTFHFTPLWRGRGCKLVATFHYPPERLSQRISPASIRALDAAILVGSNQLPFFRQFLADQKIHVVPHAIDTDYFCHGNSEREPNSVVFVGSTMRDFDTLEAVVRIAGKEAPDLRFRLVVPKEVANRFASEPNVVCHSEVGDDRLRELYGGGSVGIMPMLDCTANNSILEMMASALPIVVTDVGGIRDYLTGDGAIFVPKNDPQAMFDAVSELATNASKRSRLGDLNRVRAVEMFSFATVGAKMNTVYEAILAE